MPREGRVGWRATRITPSLTGEISLSSQAPLCRHDAETIKSIIRTAEDEEDIVLAQSMAAKASPFNICCQETRIHLIRQLALRAGPQAPGRRTCTAQAGLSAVCVRRSLSLFIPVCILACEARLDWTPGMCPDFVARVMSVRIDLYTCRVQQRRFYSLEFLQGRLSKPGHFRNGWMMM